MKIAVYHDLPSGGAKRVVYEVLRRLAERHAVDAYTLSTANLDFCDLRPWTGSHRVFEFSPSPLFESPLGRLNQLQRMRDLRRLAAVSAEVAAAIDAGGYDAVWVHPSMWIQAPHVLSLLRTPTLLYLHEAMRWAYEPDVERAHAAAGWRTEWRRAADRFDPLHRLYVRQAIHDDQANVRAAAAVQTNSAFTAANVEHIYGRRAEVCYPGVDADRFQPSDRPRAPWLLSVGEIRPNKGFDFLIEAVGRISAEKRPRLRLIGNAARSAEVELLRRLAVERNVRLEIETNVPGDLLVQRLQEAALVAYAPLREPLGLVPLEAAACGTPTVGVAEGGVRETVVDGETGRLTERSPDAFAQAIEELLNDAERTERFGREARRRAVRDWSWTRTAETVEESLARLSRAARAA